MKIRIIILSVFSISLAACSYLFIGPPLKERQFEITSMEGFSNTPKIDNLGLKNFYYYQFSGDSLIGIDGKISKRYNIIKFYNDGKLGFTGSYTHIPITDTTWHNNNLKPEGYEWGYFFTKDTNIYIQVKHRGYRHTYFWFGSIKKDQIVITHTIDLKFNLTKLEKDIIFMYKY